MLKAPSPPAAGGKGGVRRVTFVPYTCRIYGRTLRVISGFGHFGSLARMRARRGLSPPSHRPDTTPVKSRQSRRSAPCLAHQIKSAGPKPRALVTVLASGSGCSLPLLFL